MTAVLIKLGVAAAIGFVYPLISAATLIAGTSAVVRHGIKGGAVAGAGVAVALSCYGAVAIIGLGMMQFFLMPAHLAVLEIVLGGMFIALGLRLAFKRQKLGDGQKRVVERHSSGVWPYFAANLSMTFSGIQKIAFLAGLFLYFKLHELPFMEKLLVPVAMFVGANCAWLLYSIGIDRAWGKLRQTEAVTEKMERLSHLRHCRLFVRLRTVFISRGIPKKTRRLIPLLIFFIGVTLLTRGGKFFFENPDCQWRRPVAGARRR